MSAKTLLLLGMGLVACFAPLPGCVTFGGECSYRQQLEPLSLERMSEQRVQVTVGAGSLTIEAVPGLESVRIRGEACSSDPEWLADIGVDMEPRDGTLHIASVFPDIHGEQFGLDLTIEIPAGLPVVVDDSSGSIRITGVAGVEITDGSGSIELEDIAGNVRIEDGSGSVTMGGVTGDVWLSDGSGSIDIRDVQGSVTIAEDGSGSITIEDVWGDVLVGVDGSGDVEVRRVGGNFTVKEGGSGRVHFSGVEGSVTLPAGS